MDYKYTENILKDARCNYLNAETDNASSMLLSCINYDKPQPSFMKHNLPTYLIDPVTGEAMTHQEVLELRESEKYNELVVVPEVPFIIPMIEEPPPNVSSHSSQEGSASNGTSNIIVKDPNVPEEDIIEGFSSDMDFGNPYVPVGTCPVGYVKDGDNCKRVYLGTMPNYIYNSVTDSYKDPNSKLFSICKNGDQFLGIDKNGYIKCESSTQDVGQKVNMYAADSTVVPVVTTLLN